jgi:hypothetical protein
LSLSVCTDKVRIISPNGNLLSEGETRCKDIDTLKSLGYTIEYLEEPTQADSTISSFEPGQEETIQEPIIEQIETVIIQEPEIQTLVIKQEDIFDNSLVLAETNAKLKINNIELTNENNNLKSKLENVFTQEDINKLELENEVKKVHFVLSQMENNVSRRTPEDYRTGFTNYTKTLERKEIELEEFASNLGLIYNRRKVVNKEPFYYKDYIPNWTLEKWEQLP